MISQFTRIFVPAAVSLVVGLSLQGAHAAPIDSAPVGTAARMHDVFSEGLRQGSFNPFTEGARGNVSAAIVSARAHDVFSEGLRDGRFDPDSEGARGAADGALVAGLDRSGVSAPPARQFDPYSDGARTVDGDPRARGAALTGVPALV
ncbi:hypothetical protein [Cupriavidus gilardii]|uniref:hypothetical protein n=1 Tax=Cupriavidus gilardii TaxID=82541 RepID=UPI0007E3F9D9|nr:hypothetical protein [Cupriavidus gilardii]